METYLLLLADFSSKELPWDLEQDDCRMGVKGEDLGDVLGA